ncbi:hypothetical protein T492DRAFT_1084070 [Pavlovales sp. CCMP2436]|nr:hypothetical protein T492DRAFT_1084070 [Pavlovales sp. CCMP2436]|mmetsp:Transcript_16979/g.43473  ORF Transcript_16979/g.43473 Transcript_16979/m.43473 type:complete len:391 (-) Transcript_16979:103-1275(-)
MARMKGLSERLVVVAAYLTLNSALNLLNRWALHSAGFAFPLVMTASHMLFSVGCLAPVLRTLHYRQKHSEVMESRGTLLGLVAVGLCNGLQIALNNASLIYIELSINQVIRAFIPVIVALFSVCIEYKVPDRPQAAALFGVSLGVVIACAEESKKHSTVGVALTVASLVLQSAQMSLAAKMLQGLQLDSIQITLYTGPVGFVTLMPIALLTGEVSAAAHFFTLRPGISVFILVGGSVLAVLYNVVLFQTLRTFSAVGAAVLGNAKVILLLIIAHLLLGEVSDWTPSQWGGSALTFSAAAAYVYFKLFPSGRAADRLDDLKTISDTLEMPAKTAEEKQQFVVAGSASFAIDDEEDDDDGARRGFASPQPLNPGPSRAGGKPGRPAIGGEAV